MEKVAKEAARTVPGREHGGNCDVSLPRMISWTKLTFALSPFVDQEFVAWIPLLLPGFRERCAPVRRRLAFLPG